MKMQTKRRALLAAGVLLAALVIQTAAFASACSGIRGSVLRLHILAASDSPEDQQRKLLVRDAVTAACAGWFDADTDRARALDTVRARLPDIEQAARQALRQAGCGDEVHAEVARMYFSTREYDAGTLPAGVYDAVLVTIGPGEGHNWWCVVFPPLCVSAATPHATLDDVLSPAQADIVQHAEKYQVRFKVVEWWEALCETCRRWFG
ncbi:MAG: stage II sporulation protein R [Clostridia bacterium]|nr:stage II sporulation protein R [Clostridia bacterium]